MSAADQGWQPAVANYAGRDLAERQQWYSPAAAAYARVRPGYPPAWVARIAAIAGLTPGSRLLELGCGPGLATLAFARWGCSVLALEPNLDFYAIARDTCAALPHVQVQNSAFETWPLEATAFDAILAATSWHWIPAAVSYPKAAAALKPGGRLILLWNKQLQLPPALHQALQPAYDRHAPHLFRYEPDGAQIAVMEELSEQVRHSGYFCDLQAGHEWREVAYSIEEYLTLLTTYSPYLALAPEVREALLAELRAILQEQAGDRLASRQDSRLSLAYLAAYQVARCRE